VLKNRGYNPKHNFGHGKEHASELFCLLNVLSYLIHGIQDVADEEYRKARGSFGRRDAFFWALRYEMSRYLHDDWTDFLLTIAGEAPMILEFGIAGLTPRFFTETDRRSVETNYRLVQIPKNMSFSPIRTRGRSILYAKRVSR
jgi:hypothetical protein